MPVNSSHDAAKLVMPCLLNFRRGNSGRHTGEPVGIGLVVVVRVAVVRVHDPRVRRVIGHRRR